MEIEPFRRPKCAQDCINSCTFEAYAQRVSEQVPRIKDSHRVVLNRKRTTEEAISAFNAISTAREIAREAECPFLNFVSSNDFPGGKGL